MREQIKAVLDRECRDHFYGVRRNAERKCVTLPRCDDGLAFPTSEKCWMCHKHDALAREIAEIKEVALCQPR